MRRWAIRILVMFLPCIAVAQPDFWQTPGEIIRDSKGNITQEQIKDPKNFTMRVIDHGKWAFTFHYRPNTDKVVRVEAPDFTSDYGFGADPETADSMTVRGYGRPLTVRGTREVLSTEGLADVRVQRDARGRDTKVMYGSTTIATIEYHDDGGVSRFSLGNLAVAFSMTPSGMHETLTVNGKVVKETTASGYRALTPTRFSLDTVADQLNLPVEWDKVVRPHYSTMGLGPLTLTRENGDVLARLLGWNLGEVAFDRSGQPLFYDVRLNWSSIGGWTKAQSDMTLAYQGVLPDHVVVTRDGAIQAWVASPKTGAIFSVQTSLGDSSVFRFKIASSASGPGASSFNSSSSSGQNSPVLAVKTSRIHAIKPLLYYECGGWLDSECWVRGDTAGCDTIWHTNWCWQDDPPPPPDSGGGGGGGSGNTYPNNQVFGDAALLFAVNVGLRGAYAKLAATTQCSQALFQNMPIYGGRANAWWMLEAFGTDASTWLGGITFQNGLGVRDQQGVDVCAVMAPAAWTKVNSYTVYICSPFQYLTSSMAAVRVIHEELHTLGVSEFPQDPGAPYTSAQITSMVQQYCGN